MEITSDRRYHFGLEPGELWETLSSVDRYRSWWPWLRRFEARDLVPGDAWVCTVQPPLPYPVRFTVHLDEVVEPSLVTARVSGDIVGGARLEIWALDGGSDVRVTSGLAPHNGFLRLVAAAARPVVRFGHDWVFDTGARQFRERAL